MKNLKTFEEFNYSSYEEIEEGKVGDFLMKGAEKVFLGSDEKAKENAKKRFPQYIETAKRFDSDPENVKKAKAAQEEKKMEYKSAEESLYFILRQDPDVKPFWDKYLGLFVNPKKSSAKSFGGGNVSSW